MEEFMFFIRKQTNSEGSLSPERHQSFLKACESYIGNLKKEGRLISAQPIQWLGRIISRPDGNWIDVPFNESREVIGGYYHILASNMEEAMAIARANPEFVYNHDTRIEVRAIKTKETSTGFVYPKP
jgi:hypothetical protein